MTGVTAVSKEGKKALRAVGSAVVQGSKKGHRRPKKLSSAKILKILVTSRSYWKIIPCVPDFYAGTLLANFATGHISKKDEKQFFSD